MAARSVAAQPWGHLRWVLGGFPESRWSLLACVAGEQRWSAALGETIAADRLEHASLLRIAPTGGDEQQATAQELQDRQMAVAHELVGQTGELHHLFERSEVLVRSIREFLRRCGPDVLIDISCFPKRFFFPVVKLVLETSGAENVVVAYSHAAGYPAGPLAEDPEPSRPLPMFTGALEVSGPRLLAVSIGVEPLGLSQIIEGDEGFGDMRVLFPFPAAPPIGRRNWDVLRLIDQTQALRPDQIIGVDVNDVPRLVARLSQLANGRPEATSLAPFGAKPVSLAMCLFALSEPPETRPEILYTQPRRYNPEYSVGVRQHQGRPHVMAYTLRIGGKDVYPRATGA